jgi:hypothetical protein
VQTTLRQQAPLGSALLARPERDGAFLRAHRNGKESVGQRAREERARCERSRALQDGLGLQLERGAEVPADELLVTRARDETAVIWSPGNIPYDASVCLVDAASEFKRIA